MYLLANGMAVSILVLMEVLREAKNSKTKHQKLLRFNPCFDGSVERGHEAIAHGMVREKFQSLF